jgi:hypothetical protein
MLRKLFATGIAMSILFILPAQDTTKQTVLTITGSADVYYKYDFEKTAANSLTSFTSSHNSFELGMASLKFNYKTSKVELVTDLGFGKRAQQFSYNDEGILAGIKQLYISYAVSDWLKFTAGSWATHIGYELVDAHLNRNYSMSYMFTNGPFFHTGIKAELTHQSSGFMIGIANPTDFKYVPEGLINKKFLIAQYSFAASDYFKVYLNYAGGKSPDTSKTNQFDAVISSKLGEKFSIGYNGTINVIRKWEGEKNISGKTWWGSAIYLSLDPAPAFGLTLRTEFFNDRNQLKIPTGSTRGCNIFSNTLSANFKVDNLTVIPELRVDHSDKHTFIKKDGSPAKTSANVLLAAIYQF